MKLFRKSLIFVSSSQTLLVRDVRRFTDNVFYCLVSRLVQENPELAMDSIVHITQQMNQARRAELSRILATLETGVAVNSNGDSGS